MYDDSTAYMKSVVVGAGRRWETLFYFLRLKLTMSKVSSNAEPQQVKLVPKGEEKGIRQSFLLLRVPPPPHTSRQALADIHMHIYTHIYVVCLCVCVCVYIMHIHIQCTTDFFFFKYIQCMCNNSL